MPHDDRTGRRHVSRSTLVLRWLGLALLCGVALAYVQPIRSYQATKAELAVQRQRLAELTQRRDVLRERLSRAESEEFVAREARRLGLVRRGERLYIVDGVDEWKDARTR